MIYFTILITKTQMGSYLQLIWRKAFDSLEHAFIFATLAKFEFGKDDIQWIRTFLYNGSSCIIDNSFSTGYFSLERGARQDDLLSPYIFILCLKILFIKSEATKQ